MVELKRRRRNKVERPFCWYCERKFVDERVLIMHQKARHFKCDTCYKKLGSAIGLVVHQHQMHGKSLKGVPNSKSGKESVEREVYGMDGLSLEEINEFRTRTNPALIRQKSKAAQTELMEKSAAATANEASSSAAPSTSAGQAQVVLVFSSPEYSQEELRAKLTRYAYDEAKVRKQMSRLDSAVESKLAKWAR